MMPELSYQAWVVWLCVYVCMRVHKAMMAAAVMPLAALQPTGRNTTELCTATTHMHIKKSSSDLTCKKKTKGKEKSAWHWDVFLLLHTNALLFFFGFSDYTHLLLSLTSLFHHRLIYSRLSDKSSIEHRSPPFLANTTRTQTFLITTFFFFFSSQLHLILKRGSQWLLYCQIAHRLFSWPALCHYAKQGE